MYESCLKKQQVIKDMFKACSSEEAKYMKIIELGRELSRIDSRYKTPENVVKGCQSIVYLHSFLDGGNVIYEAESDALISSGLAVLLFKVYSGEQPETILKCPPSYLDELGISASLTPGRANGLYSMHLRMKQDALKFLLNTQRQ